MRAKVAVFALLLLVVSVPAAHMQDERPPLVVANTEQIPLTSETNGHEYLLTIALPASYTTTEQFYPVLYVLDPKFALLTVTEFARGLAGWQEIPELIIVGIDYPTDDLDEIMRLRERDYYLAQDDFLEFMNAEVFPLVDSQYRTDAVDRGLIGYSYGGDLVFHILATNPAMFNRYVAIDASAGEMMRRVRRDDDVFRESFAGLDVKLFISTTGFSNAVADVIKQRAYDGLDVTGLALGNVTHGAALHLSLAPGIMAIYADSARVILYKQAISD